MPVYLYLCEKHKEFEIQQSIKDLPLDHCPKCKIEGLKNVPPKKLIASTSFILKGGGWGKEGYS